MFVVYSFDLYELKRRTHVRTRLELLYPSDNLNRRQRWVSIHAKTDPSRPRHPT